MHTLATLALLLTMSSPVRPPSGQPAPMQPGDYTPAGPSKVVSWQLKRLAPPSALYVTVDDVLRVSAASSQANEVVTISYRWLRAADGTVDFGQFTIAPASNRTLKVFDQPMAEGFLISISCKAAVATTRGQTFVRLFLNPKAAGAGQPGYMLMADYVTTAMAPGHPNGRILAPSEGPGWINTVSLASPGGGTDWNFAVPVNARWRPIGLFTQFNTDATVATRVLTFLINAGGGTVWETYAFATVPASCFIRLNLTALPQSQALGGDALHQSFVVPIPPGLILLGGGTIGSSTIFGDALDTYTGINLEIEEWLDNV